MPASVQTLAPIIAQLITVFVPVIRQITDEIKAAQTDVPVGERIEPTDEQVIAKFNADIDKYLAEGKAWSASHRV